MANNFKSWVDSPTAGQQVQSASVFATDAQRVDGFKAGDPASALRVNSALRQANIVVAGLMQMCDDIKTLPDGLSLMSTVTQVKNAIKAAIDQLDATVLASAKSYTNTRESVINGKLTNKQNQITSNKNRLDTLEPRVDDLEDEVAALSGGSSTLGQRVTAIDTSTTYATRTLTMDGLTSYSQLVGKRIRVEIPSAPAGTTYFHFQTSASTVNINGLGALPLYFRIGGTLIQGASNNTAGSQIIASGSNVTGFPRPTWYELLYVPDGGGRFECTELISHMASAVYDGLMSSSNYNKLANIDTSKLNDLPAFRWTGRERCDPDYGVDISGYFDRDGMYLVTLELMNNGRTATYASVWMLYTTTAVTTADIPAMKGSPVNAGAENLLVTGRVIIDDGGYQMKIWGTGAFNPAIGQEDTSQDPSYALQDSYVTGIYFLCGM